MGSYTSQRTNVGGSVLLPDRFDRVIFMEAACETAVLSENNSNSPAAGAFLRRLLTEGRDQIYAAS